MDYIKNYNAWLNDDRLNEEGKAELIAIAGKEKEKIIADLAVMRKERGISIDE